MHQSCEIPKPLSNRNLDDIILYDLEEIEDAVTALKGTGSDFRDEDLSFLSNKFEGSF